MEDALEKTIEELKNISKKECVNISADLSEDMTQFDSKFGGTPYIPNGFEYPYSKSNPEQPLKLLAQINFADVPHMRDFPEKGILQIYINPADDRYYGSDSIISNDIVMLSHAINRKPESKVLLEAYEHLMRLKPVKAYSQYRVIYHENVDYSANNTDKIPSEIANVDFIVEKPLKLTFKSGVDYIPYGTTEHDERFDELFLEIYDKYADDDNKSEEVEDIEGAQYDIEQNFYSYGIHKMGGYPNSIHQADWDISDDYVLLLQIGSYDDSIRWGDDGVAHFMISRKALKKRDFSQVDYSWECY